MSRTVAIVGLGLIGGSLARDLAARGLHVMGRDQDRTTEQDARSEGAIAEIVDDELRALGRADWLVLAVPVRQAAAVLRRAAPHLARAELITDTGSTKRGVLRAAAELQLAACFVGSHPLAGDHRAGWPASRAGLFADARVYVCPTAASSARARAAADELWALCGAHTVDITAAAHDQLLAHTSHLPQVVASALALVLDEAGVGPDQLGPGGRDMLRLAASSPDLWADILSENDDHVAAALHALERQLRGLREAVADPERAAALLRRANAWRRGGPGAPLAGTPADDPPLEHSPSAHGTPA